jgi:hypothetical protein
MKNVLKKVLGKENNKDELQGDRGALEETNRNKSDKLRTA